MPPGDKELAAVTKENNPDQLNTDTESIIYSAVAWFLNAFNPISTLDNKTSNQVAVPSEYICSTTNPLKGDVLNKKLFSYVYQCEGGNGDSASEDGYKYRGHGAVQLTWKKTNVPGFRYMAQSQLQG